MFIRKSIVFAAFAAAAALAPTADAARFDVYVNIGPPAPIYEPVPPPRVGYSGRRATGNTTATATVTTGIADSGCVNGAAMPGCRIAGRSVTDAGISKTVTGNAPDNPDELLETRRRAQARLF